MLPPLENIKLLPHRLRYALITGIGRPELFATESANQYCKPEQIPEPFGSVTRRVGLTGSGSFANAKKLAFDLSYGHERGKSLSTYSTKALESIYAGGKGCCSDYTQVFVGLCLKAGIKVREWGLNDGFSTMQFGHCCNEIFSTEHRKWVFIDPYFSVYATSSRIPLSMTELIDLATAKHIDQIHFHWIDQHRANRTENRVTRYFLDPDNVYFLISNCSVFEQERILWALVALPTSLVHFALLILGKYQRFWVYENRNNSERVRREVSATKSIRFVAWGHA